VHECERDGNAEGVNARIAKGGYAARGAMGPVGRGGRRGSRACWVDGCWYGFQEEREGEG